jgi:hypothetical protein
MTQRHRSVKYRICTCWTLVKRILNLAWPEIKPQLSRMKKTQLQECRSIFTQPLAHSRNCWSVTTCDGYWCVLGVWNFAKRLIRLWVMIFKASSRFATLLVIVIQLCTESKHNLSSTWQGKTIVNTTMLDVFCFNPSSSWPWTMCLSSMYDLVSRYCVDREWLVNDPKFVHGPSTTCEI